MKELKAHLFVCTNAPQAEGKCGHKNAETLRRELKDNFKNSPWTNDIRVNASGCLGHCEKGIAAVLYPDAKWFLELKTTDAKTLFEEVSASLEKHK